MEARNLDWLRRGVRTFVQAFIGVMATTMVPILYDLIQAAGEADGELVKIDVNLLGNVLISAVVAGIIALISMGQNWAEDNTRLPAVLKAKPSTGQNPVPDPNV